MWLAIGQSEGQADYMCTWVNYLVSLRVYLGNCEHVVYLYPLFSFLKFTAKLRRWYKVSCLSFPTVA